MSAIFKYLQQFYKEEFKLYYFLVVLIVLGGWIFLNYRHGLESRYAAGYDSKWKLFLGYYFLYLIPFATAFLLQLLFYKNCTYYQSPWFWVILILAPAIFSFRVNFNFHQPFIKKIWSGDEQLFWLSCLNYVVRVFVVLVPVFIIWWIKDKSNQPFYGSSALKDIKPYFIMLIIMIPLIALASTQKDFLHMYPRAKNFDTLELPLRKLRYFIYEFAYGLDFLSIEFFFRGFLIVALLKICGPHCIIPAACFYCTIHFGKPLGEAISSFWGGLLLGIISYNTGSIWGGLIVHLGIAWLMEGVSWIAILLKK